MRYPTKCEIANIAIWHDFYDKFVDRSDFEYCEMDTDSPYTAFSSNSLEDVNVRMEMKAYQLLRKARGNPQSNDQELFATQNHLQRYIGVWFTHRFHFQTCRENLEFS